MIGSSGPISTKILTAEGTTASEEKARYDTVIADFLASGYTRRQKEVTKSNTNMVTMAAVAAAATGAVATFTATPGNRWASYMGMEDVPLGSDHLAAYGFGIIAADTGDNEVNDFTGVEISLNDPTSQAFAHVDTVYMNVSLTLSKAATNYPVKRKTMFEFFRFGEGALLNGSQTQEWDLVAPDIAVTVANSYFLGKYDFWV
jgi:hypothetical protein